MPPRRGGRPLHPIYPHSPAAKGRVERANQTLQDRLVKELRLHGVCDREVGNGFLPTFMADYNRRFARVPLSSHDAHRPLLAHENLIRVFTWQEERRLTMNLTLHYKRVMYIVELSATSEAARGKQVLVIESEDGSVRIEYRGTELAARAFPKDARVSQAAVVENKVLSSALLVIKAKQEHRDRVAREKRTLTLRNEDHLRKALGESGLHHGRDARERAPNPLSLREEDLARKALGVVPGLAHRRPVGRPTIAELARRRLAAEAAAATSTIGTATPIAEQILAQTLHRLHETPSCAVSAPKIAKSGGRKR